MTALTYFTLTGNYLPDTSLGSMSGTATITMLVSEGSAFGVPTIPGVVVPNTIPVNFINGQLCDKSGNPGVSLLANTAALNLTGNLFYTISFALFYHPSSGNPVSVDLNSVTFEAPTSAVTIDLSTLTPAAGVEAAQLVTVVSGDITDATTLGRQLLTASSGAAAAAAIGALSSSAVVNNTDGTLSVNANNALEPLSTTTILTTSTAPTIGQTTYYNATSGNLTPALPALSGLRAGARLAVRRDPADVSQNTVTLTCAGSDTFYSSGSTSSTLPMMGELREYQVISVAGTKYWAPAGSVNPVAALDNRYLAGASKLVSIGDNGWGSAAGLVTAASTVGTGEMFFNIGVAATGIHAAWNHFYTDILSSNSRNDIDPSGPITFSASLRVVSSTNPATVTNQLWRLTFGGRNTATLDPGGRILSDPLGLSLAPGDVVAVRTYLSSGTAYAPNQTNGGTSGAHALVPGGFTAASDLTAPGSAAIPGSLGYYYGPANVLGYPDNANSAKSVLVLGDSIAHGGGDVDALYTVPTIPPGFLPRALSGKAGILNISIGGDQATWFQGTNGSFRRLSSAARCNSAIIEYGTNDFVSGVTAAAFEATVLNLANDVRRLGISKVFLLTVVPRTTSTDNWATTTNQTADPNNPQRVLYNTWVRANCPIDPTTKAPVAVGTSGALLAGSFGHPVTGMFDVAATVESSLNSGLWAAANRVATGSMTSSGFVLSTSSTTFNSANQESGGDKGLAFFLAGAGAAGAVLEGDLVTYNSSTSFQTNTVASTTVTNAPLVIGPMTIEGIHPTSRGHNLMAQAINTAWL